MNILFIIGNGFDLNLGLKTSYEDFYKWYIESYGSRKQNVVDFINKINEEKPNNKLWSSMELALGEYTSQLNSESTISEYIELHDNLVEAMSSFITEQESTINLSSISKSRFNHYFITPESYADLKLEHANQLSNFRHDHARNANNWNLNIMSFNYSNSLEKITGFETGVEIGSFYSNGSGKITVKSIEHIHGTTDDRLIIGVNSTSQVANESLHKTRAIDYIVKPSFNALCGEGHDKRCRDLINNANLIVLFGCSFGTSDLQWWNTIINKMKSNNAKLLIFNREYGVGFNSLAKHKKQHYLEDVKDKFISSTTVSLTAAESRVVKNNTYVGHNTAIFSPITD